MPSELKMHLRTFPEDCTGCRICENFCSFHHEGAIWPAQARVTVVGQADEGPFVPNICRQCDDAPCAAVCPVEAIVCDERIGAWMVDVEECIGCALCVDACSYGMMFFDQDKDVAFKCNLCEGEPECVAMCPTGAIGLRRADSRTATD